LALAGEFTRIQWHVCELEDPYTDILRTILSFSYHCILPLSLTNPRDALHHGKRAANEGGRLV